MALVALGVALALVWSSSVRRAAGIVLVLLTVLVVVPGLLDAVEGGSLKVVGLLAGVAVVGALAALGAATQRTRRAPPHGPLPKARERIAVSVRSGEGP